MDLGHTQSNRILVNEMKMRGDLAEIDGMWDKGGFLTSPELKVLFLTGTLVVFTGSVCSFTCKLLLLLEMTMSDAWLITISSSFAFLLIVPALSKNLSAPIGRSRRPPLARA